MIHEARRHQPAMVVVGALLVLGFLAIAAATVLSVVGDDTPEPATMAVLPLSSDIEVIDAHQTCNAEACDGEGAVLLSAGRTASDSVALVESALRAAGWWEHRCGDDETCLRRNDLGVEIVPWVAVLDQPSTAAMAANLAGMAVEAEALVYVRVFRCNVLTACATRFSQHGSIDRVLPSQVPAGSPARGNTLGR